MFANVLKTSKFLKNDNSRNLYVLNRLYAYWNKDWLPSSYPNTDIEREKAAKKYNLHPKEYKPYADDGFGHGDYPKLPFLGAVTRDPFYPYDNPEYKRNFNEAVHVDVDMLGEDRYDAGATERYSKEIMIASFVLIFGSLFGLCYISKYIPVFQPVAEKQYPWKGKTYHTFEKYN